MKYWFTAACLLLLATNTFAQSVSFRPENAPNLLDANNNTLPLAWLGGLNSPQFSTVKLNDDQWEDLVVFDRTNSKLYTLITQQNTDGTFSYVYRPEYEVCFPPIEHWVALRDYDNDGKKDIFMWGTLGIKVYRNTTLTAGQPSFTQVSNGLMSTSFSGNPLLLTVDGTDYPSIIDIDNDGDLDFINFEFAGATLEWHKNTSIETTGTAGLTYQKNGCWGEMAKSTDCGDYMTGIVCKSDGGGRLPAPQNVNHNGANALVLNLDGDNDYDVLAGEFHCQKLTALINGGGANPANAAIESFNYGFPLNNPVNFYVFPTAYYQDINADGKRDLLVSPSTYNNDENLMDLSASVWLYENTGTDAAPNFVWQRNNFLQHWGMDLGEDAVPTFADMDADGDLDLFVGHRGTLNNNVFAGTVVVYQNIGSSTQPVFKLYNNDFLAIKNIGLRNIKPLFGYLNNDNALDFAFIGSTASGTTQIFYYLNTSSASQALAYTATASPSVLPLTFSAGDAPNFVHLNADGLSDLLIGKANGTIYSVLNQSTANNLAFTVSSTNFGNLQGKLAYSVTTAVADFDQNGQNDLLVSDANGHLKLYADFLNVPALIADTTLFQTTLSPAYTQEYFGTLSYPTAADLDGDTFPDLLIGLRTGGLTYRRNTTNVPLAAKPNLTHTWQAFPNPSHHNIQITGVTRTTLCQITDTQGRLLKQLTISHNNFINITDLADGVYFLNLTDTAGHQVIKFLKQ